MVVLTGLEPVVSLTLGQVRNSRLLSLPLGMLLCSPRFRFASACGGQPTGLTLISAPHRCERCALAWWAKYITQFDSILFSVPARCAQFVLQLHRAVIDDAQEVFESIGHAVRNRDRGQARAPGKSITSNARHAF